MREFVDDASSRRRRQSHTKASGVRVYTVDRDQIDRAEMIDTSQTRPARVAAQYGTGQFNKIVGRGMSAPRRSPTQHTTDNAEARGRKYMEREQARIPKKLILRLQRDPSTDEACIHDLTVLTCSTCRSRLG